jgi:hypothetical protein
MQVPKWEKGIPTPWDERELLNEGESEFGATKEIQLEALDLTRGKLTYDGEPVIINGDVSETEDEFTDARICDGFELRP